MTAAVVFLLAATFTRPLERVSTIDPAASRSIYDAHAVQLVYEAPLAIDYRARPYRVAPAYCELPEISDDKLTYVFRVRHDEWDAEGPARCAGDVVRALERLREPASPNGWIMKDIAAVEAVDAETVKVTLKRPTSYFLWLMAHTACSVVGPDGRGTGAYRLARWRKNHEMVFERRVSSSSDAFDTVRYLVIDDATTRLLMFLKGEVDYLGDIPQDTLDNILGPDGELAPELRRKGVTLHSIPALEVFYVGFNMDDRVVGGDGEASRKLRQALNCAFDFERWRKYYNGRVDDCTTPVPPGIPGRLETPTPYRQNLDKARRLLAEAGYADGVDPATGRRLVLTLSIGRADQSSRESGELLASFFDRIGVKLELDFMTWNAYMQAVNEGRFQLFTMGWTGDYPDAQNFLQMFYGPNRSPGVNHMNYASDEYDRAYERGDYRRCQEIIREDCPWIFLHYKKEYTLLGARVGNYLMSDFPYGEERYFEAKDGRRD